MFARSAKPKSRSPRDDGERLEEHVGSQETSTPRLRKFEQIRPREFDRRENSAKSITVVRSEPDAAKRGHRGEIVTKEIAELLDSPGELRNFCSVDLADQDVTNVRRLFAELESLHFDGKKIGDEEALSVDKELRAKWLHITGELSALEVDWRRRVELKGMLEEFLHAWQETSRDGDILAWSSWTVLLKPVEQYLSNPDAQTPSITKYMLQRLLDCVLRPFVNCKEAYKYSIWKNPIYVAIALAVLALVGPKYHLLSAFWIGWFAPALWTSARLINLVKTLMIASKGEAVKKQLQLSDFPGEEVVRGICELERRRVFVPTLIYSVAARLPLKSNFGP